jgi:hypothetical protein
MRIYNHGCMLAIALLGVGCTRSTPATNQVASSWTPAPPFVTSFSSSPHCSSLKYHPPVRRLALTYRTDGAEKVRKTVVDVSGALVTSMTEFPENRTLPPTPPQRSIAGMFTAGGGTGSSKREVLYAENPVLVLQRLRVGQEVKIEATETSDLGRRHAVLSVPTLIKYEACGTLRAANDDMPVKVYRISTARRSFDRARKTDGVRRSTTRFYFSDSLGYPIGYQDETFSILDRVEGPSVKDSQLTPAEL